MLGMGLKKQYENHHQLLIRKGPLQKFYVAIEKRVFFITEFISDS